MKTVLKIAVIGILALLISGFDTDYLADREKPTCRKICILYKVAKRFGGLPKDTTMAASHLLSLCMSWAKETALASASDNNYRSAKQSL